MTFVTSAFHMYVLHFGHFFENRKNSGLTPGQNDDPVTRTWKMTKWPTDPVTQFHVWYAFALHLLYQKNACSKTAVWAYVEASCHKLKFAKSYLLNVYRMAHKNVPNSNDRGSCTKTWFSMPLGNFILICVRLLNTCFEWRKWRRHYRESRGRLIQWVRAPKPHGTPKQPMHALFFHLVN